MYLCKIINWFKLIYNKWEKKHNSRCNVVTKFDDDNDDLPEYLAESYSVVVGERKFRLEAGGAYISVRDESRNKVIMELDPVAGRELYAQVRAEEIARRAVEKAKEEAAAEAAEPETQEQEYLFVGDCDHGNANVPSHADDLRRKIGIFSKEALEKSWSLAKYQESERRSRFESVLKSAAQNSGFRTRPVPCINDITEFVAELRLEFPNFHSVIDTLEAALALSIGDPIYTMPPLLMHGEPGIGKTHFATTIADRLGVPFDMVSAGSLQGGFDLSGTSSHWGNASAGRVVRLLAEGDSASPVFLIDEVDKVGGEERYSALHTMLDLLEPRTAKRFRDEALQLQFDASRMIVIMTANDLGSIPAPLLSRSQVVEIKPLTVEQRFAVVRGMVDQYAGDLSIGDDTVERISATGDIRKLRRTIKKAAGLAKARGDRNEFFAVIEAESKPEVKGRIGF
jgi:ATP-dependent Lon protease